MNQQLVHIALIVRDYDEAIKFYIEKSRHRWYEVLASAWPANTIET